MEQVPSSKASRESLVISHICGNGPRCWNQHHLHLEPKWINDERTKCHFVIKHYVDKNGDMGVEGFINSFCPHTPKCCTLE